MVSWSQRASSTASGYVRLQYTTDGSTYADYPTATAMNSINTFELKSVDLSSLAGVANNPNFGFRIVSEFQSTAVPGGTTNAYVTAPGGSGYTPGGTIRFDMVSVYGTALPPVSAIDIGLRVFDGHTNSRIAMEPSPGTPASPMRIRKNGTNYGVLLVATNSPDASRVRMTASATVVEFSDTFSSGSSVEQRHPGGAGRKLDELRNGFRQTLEPDPKPPPAATCNSATQRNAGRHSRSPGSVRRFASFAGDGW